MDRPRHGHRKPHRRDGRPPGRRPPPPPQTGLEAAYLEARQLAGTPLVVSLSDGTTVCGTLQENDREQIILEDSSGPLVIRKSDIRYLYEDDGGGGGGGVRS